MASVTTDHATLQQSGVDHQKLLIRVVGFDCDDVLVESQIIAGPLAAEVANLWGQTKYGDWREFQPEFLEGRPISEMLPRHCDLINQEIKSGTLLEVTDDDLRKIIDQEKRLIWQTLWADGIEAIPGTKEAIATAQQLGWKTPVISRSNDLRVFITLMRSGLDQYIPPRDIFTFPDAEVDKYREVWELIEDQAGTPRNVLIIEDSISAGQKAVKAGYNLIGTLAAFDNDLYQRAMNFFEIGALFVVKYNTDLAQLFHFIADGNLSEAEEKFGPASWSH